MQKTDEVAQNNKFVGWRKDGYAGSENRTELDMRTQLDKAKLFRALHERRGAFIIPNPYDAGSAKLLAAIGFEALATTSLGYANLLGQSRVSLMEILENARVIVEATDLPVSIDLENCGADLPKLAAEAVPLAAETGAVGGSIEDSTKDPQKPIYDFSLAVERVQAAVEAARALSFPFTLTARAENFLHDRKDIDDTIRRLQAFEAAGADVLYAPGLYDLATIKTVVSALKKPFNLVMGFADPTLTVEQVSAAGVKRLSVGGALSRVALAAFLRCAREMKDQGSFTFVREMAPINELRGAFAAGQAAASADVKA
jgi:2-methylisocitrate lyase-like PEP mutase family enzyme